jgi:hypothetical protein
MAVFNGWCWPPALARQVIHPELAPAVEARPLSVYAQLLEADYD